MLFIFLSVKYIVPRSKPLNNRVKQRMDKADIGGSLIGSYLDNSTKTGLVIWVNEKRNG